jgi:hypothetical protein
MQYNKLDISQEERRERRANQCRKATYKCACGRTLYCRPGDEWVCAACYRESLKRAEVAVGEQMELFTLEMWHPGTPMVEVLGKVAVLHRPRKRKAA